MQKTSLRADVILFELGLSDPVVSHTAGNGVALDFEVVSMMLWFLEPLASQELQARYP